MADATHQAEENEPKPERRIFRTSGELFDDGSAIELVAEGRDHKPQLLFRHEETTTVAPEVTRDGRVYRPIELGDSVWSATRLPSRASDSCVPTELFAETAEMFQQQAGLLLPSARALTAWNASTWVPHLFLSPPPLLISGPDMDQAVSLLSLLACVTRKPLFLADVMRKALLELVDRLRPTLLINAPHLSRSNRRFCQTSNYSGLFALAGSGTLSSVPCSKVFFVGEQTGHDWWSGTAIHLSLPINGPFSYLDVRKQTEIAERYQPRWLKFRLDRVLVAQTSETATEGGVSAHSAVGQLQACVQDHAELCGELAELMRAQQEESRATQFLDPSTAVIEVLWPLFHACEKPVSVGTVTAFVNSLLASRGGTRKYDAAEIGTLLSNLSVSRRRKNSGVYLSMDPDSNRAVHRSAAAYGVGNAVPGCAYCQAAAVKESQGSAPEKNNLSHGNDGEE